jgi:hypothetical protein
MFFRRLGPSLDGERYKVSSSYVYSYSFAVITLSYLIP